MSKKHTKQELMKQKDQAGKRWFINGQGQTFAVIDGPGNPLAESAAFSKFQAGIQDGCVEGVLELLAKIRRCHLVSPLR